MSIVGPGETACEASHRRPDGAFLDLLRAVAIIAVVAGGGGSVALTWYAGHQSDSRSLVALFVIWVLSPFVGLVLADMASKHWSVFARATLYNVMLVLVIGSLAIYGAHALRPPRTQAAFVFIVVPPASWLLIVIIVTIAGLKSRRLPRRKHGA